jgi:hypothetical protein
VHVLLAETSPEVGNVIAYVSNQSLSQTGQLFAIDANQQAMLFSDNDGLTWQSINVEYYNSTKSQNILTSCISVPYVWDSATLSGAAPTSQYKVSGTSWGGEYTWLFVGVN